MPGFPRYFFPLVCVLLLPACDQNVPDKQYVTLAGSTMGTGYTVRINANLESGLSSAIQDAVENRLQDINNSMSTYITDSELSRINRAPVNKWVSLSDPLSNVLYSSFSINRKSLGYFDITVGPLVNLWGFGPDKKPAQIPGEKLIEKAMLSVGMDKLMLDTGKSMLLKTMEDTYIDLSAIAKGYAVDSLGQLLVDDFNLHHFMVDIGGEITARGTNPEGIPWQIGIEVPTDGFRSVETIVALENQSLATSGDYRNYYEMDGKRYTHTINPGTGRPVNHNLVAVTVIHAQCMLADAWATALLAAGPDLGMQLANSHGLEVHFTIREDGKFKRLYSRSFKKRFTDE